MADKNQLNYGDNLEVPRRYVRDKISKQAPRNCA